MVGLWNVWVGCGNRAGYGIFADLRHRFYLVNPANCWMLFHF